MDIYFMRHGETGYNQKHLLQGQRDIALNDAGKEQARNAAEWCGKNNICFRRVFSSPLLRARETAEIVSGFPEEKIEIDPRLIEIDFGPIEGKKWEDLSDTEMNYVNDPWNGRPVRGVEPADQLIARVSEFLEDLRAQVREERQESAAAADHDAVLAVTHGMALHGILTALTRDRGLWKVPLGNCCIFHVRTDGNMYSAPERLTPPVPTFR